MARIVSAMPGDDSPTRGLALVDWTSILRIYAGYRLRQLRVQNSSMAQLSQLMRLVQKARNTAFGRDHNFDQIRNIADYQRRVPIRKYEDFWQSYWRDSFPCLDDCSWPGRIPYFGMTAGTTTGETKRVPFSSEYLRFNRRARLDLLIHHVQHRPTSRVLAGKPLALTSSANMTTVAPGVSVGLATGVILAAMPRWERSRTLPNRQDSEIVEWPMRLRAIARSIAGENIRSIVGMPNWLLAFFAELAGQGHDPMESRQRAITRKRDL